MGMFVRQRGAGAIKTLIEQFEYPRLGPGMMWERFAEIVQDRGQRVDLNTTVRRIFHENGRVTAVEVESAGRATRIPCAHVISTTPVPQLVAAFEPALPSEAAKAAARLTHRDFLTVALILEQADVFPDNWIYIHDDAVKVGRVQNYKNWSPEMVPDPGWTCLGLEYFCSVGDALWEMSDPDLVALAKREIAQVGLANPDLVRDAVVVRVRKAYPVYDAGYAEALEVVKSHLAPFPNLQLVGRNGMHKYNNQDHSMLTALLAVENVFGAGYDLWSVNADDEYHEHVGEAARHHPRFGSHVQAMSATQPRVPVGLPDSRG
jgi:protoporphyrinogen oxidase